MSPVLLACEIGRDDIVQMLLNAGCNHLAVTESNWVGDVAECAPRRYCDADLGVAPQDILKNAPDGIMGDWELEGDGYKGTLVFEAAGSKAGQIYYEVVVKKIGDKHPAFGVG